MESKLCVGVVSVSIVHLCVGQCVCARVVCVYMCAHVYVHERM